MEITDTAGKTFSLAQRVYRIVYLLFPTLFGLFMILWGIFLNDWDWTLIVVGLFVFLVFGGGTYRAITAADPADE